jgi:hypothetical protein
MPNSIDPEDFFSEFSEILGINQQDFLPPSYSPEANYSDRDFAATVTANQFKSLGRYAELCLKDQEMYRKYISSLKKRDDATKKIDFNLVKLRLINSWNTEKLIRFTKDHILDSDGFVLQWIFPQAYYSVFNSTLAFFEVAGHSEKSHSSVKKKLASLCKSQKYPEKLCIWSDGGQNSIETKGLDCSMENYKSLSYRDSDENNLRCHIASFLNVTREKNLKEKREEMKTKFKTKKGKYKKNLDQSDWDAVSTYLGQTSFLCLLYRKRIKANYQDIDTFLSESIDALDITNSIISLVNTLNFTNELIVRHTIGAERMAEWIKKVNGDFLSNRYAMINDLFDN